MRVKSVSIILFGRKNVTCAFALWAYDVTGLAGRICCGRCCYSCSVYTGHCVHSYIIVGFGFGMQEFYDAEYLS